MKSSVLPVLVDASDSELGNPWSFDFMTKMFDMADNSGDFKTSAECRLQGFHQTGNTWTDSKKQRWVPVYEAKMIHSFDHRWATYDGPQARDTLVSERSVEFEVDPRFWLPLKRVKNDWRPRTGSEPG